MSVALKSRAGYAKPVSVGSRRRPVTKWRYSSQNKHTVRNSALTFAYIHLVVCHLLFDYVVVFSQYDLSFPGSPARWHFWWGPYHQGENDTLKSLVVARLTLFTWQFPALICNTVCFCHLFSAHFCALFLYDTWLFFPIRPNNRSTGRHEWCLYSKK